MVSHTVMNRSVMSSPSVSCGRGSADASKTSVLWQALDRKTATALSSSALFWGSVNFVIFAVLIACLQSLWISSYVLYWWSCICGCCVCGANILTHLWHYLYPALLLQPVPVTGKKQQHLLSLNDDECSSKKSDGGKPSAAETPVKLSLSFSSLLQQSLRTPQPSPGQNLSATLHNNSALSWASSFCVSPNSPVNHSWGNSCMSPLGVTAGGVNTSWLSGCELAGCMAGAGGCGGCHTANSTNSPQFFMPSPHHNCSTSFNSTGICSNSSMLGSPNTSIAANSWSFLPHLPQNSAVTPPAQSTPNIPLPKGRPITTRRQLDAYITEYQQQRANASSVVDQCNSSSGGSGAAGGAGGGLWCYSNSTGSGSASMYQQQEELRRNAYQKAVPDPVRARNGSDANNSDESKDVSNSTGASKSTKVWTRRNVSSRMLFQFEENLRIWLCGAVVQPLVKAIDDVNIALADIAPDMQIGSVGVEKLRKVCASQLSGVRQVSGLVPFLECAPSQQQYLVSRLRQLGKGGALSVYCWNKGGQAWTDQCPTDAMLLVQLFALYLDSQLPPDPSQSEGRVFSSQHIVITPDKPPQHPDHAVLHFTKLSPPHVQVILPGEGECEVGEGHKNVLHCLLLFIHHLIHTKHSVIAGVNLALTGVNLAWVVTDTGSGRNS
uniref:Transmembrane protein 209-like n=1 Tax=Hirondellea gigas TaxID=1518452 RepID=A0A6A7G0P1_9CRUS